MDIKTFVIVSGLFRLFLGPWKTSALDEQFLTRYCEYSTVTFSPERERGPKTHEIKSGHNFKRKEEGRVAMKTYKAYGKINLGLDVVRRLPNGYHEVKMIMQAVDLHDLIHMESLPQDEILIHSGSEKIPCDESNLAYKAAKRMKELFDIKQGVDITIEKNIPVAAGMAGGSTDCAAVLKGMKELFDLQLSLKELQEIGVKLGADVPYCLMGKTALSEGIGEVLTPLPTPPACVLLLAKPDIDVSTKYVYEHLQLDKLEKHPDIDGMVQAIKDQDLHGICDRMDNVLETVTGEKYAIVHEIEQKMEEFGAIKSIMSGSGPTVFGIFEDKEKAEKAKAEILALDMAKEVHVSGFCEEV